MTQRGHTKDNAAQANQLSLGGVRAFLRETLTSDSEFDAFCLDNFPDVYKHYSIGMDRIHKETLLLQSESHDTTALQSLLISYRDKPTSNPLLKCPIVATFKMENVNYRVSHDARGKRIMVPASGHTLRLTVEALDSRTTILQSLVPVIHSRDTATGTMGSHLGLVEPRPFEILLDESPPCLRPIHPRGPRFPFKVGPGDPEIFDLTVLTDTGDVRWWLELSWTSMGQQGVLRVDFAGSPFRTMALPTGANDGE